MNLVLKNCMKCDFAEDSLKKEFSFVKFLILKKSVDNGEGIFYFQAKTEEECTDWVRCIRLEMSTSNMQEN